MFNMWLAVGVGAFIGCLIFGIICLLGIGSWYVGDLREDRSSGDDQPYYFMEISHGALSRVKKNRFVLLRVKREDYIAKNTEDIK